MKIRGLKLITEYNRGFSLTEILISLSLGLLLTLSVTGVFLQNKNNVKLENGMSRLQENLRFANYYFNQIISMTGYLGCSNPNTILPYILAKDLPSNTLDNTQIVTGHHAINSFTWIPSLPPSLVGKVRPNTDLIKIQKAGTTAVFLSVNMQDPASEISLQSNKLNINTNNILVISDCQSADVFRASSGTNLLKISHTAPENLSNLLSKAYQTDARVMKFESFIFYIKNTGRTNQSGNPIFSLFNMDVDGNETELIEGAENLQIQYGVNTNNNGTADSYLTADNISTNNLWDKIVSIRMNILLNSIEAIDLSPQSYQFNGQTYNNNDKIRRQAFSLTIYLRNRFL